MNKKLIERTVQNKAQAFLENYYQTKYKPKKLYGKIEVYTSKKYGNKRADGFIAFRRGGKPYVVSMESKSHKTIKALKPYRVNKLWIRESIWAGFIFCLMSGSLFFTWRAEDLGLATLYRFLIPITAFAIGSIGYAFLFRNSYKFQELAVVKQILQYPANEQWISFSKDAFQLLSESKRKILVNVCKARGLGLLVVDKWYRIENLNKPKRRRKLFGNFLKYYKNNQEIANYLKLK